MQPGLSYWIPSSITPYYCHWGYEHPSIWPKNHPHVHKCTTQEWENGGARNDDFWLLCLGPWGYLIRAGLAPNGNFPEQYNIPQPSPATCVASLLWQIGPELVGEFIFSVQLFISCSAIVLAICSILKLEAVNGICNIFEFEHVIFHGILLLQLFMLDGILRLGFI